MSKKQVHGALSFLKSQWSRNCLFRLQQGHLNLTPTLLGLLKNISEKGRQHKLIFYSNTSNNSRPLFKIHIMTVSGYHIKCLHACSVTFLRVIFAETRSFAKCHTASRMHETGFLSLFLCWTNSTPSRCRASPFFTRWNIKCFMFFCPPHTRSAGSFTGSRLRGGSAVGVEASDSSSALSSLIFSVL